MIIACGFPIGCPGMIPASTTNYNQGIQSSFKLEHGPQRQVDTYQIVRVPDLGVCINNAVRRAGPNLGRADPVVGVERRGGVVVDVIGDGRSVVGCDQCEIGDCEVQSC